MGESSGVRGGGCLFGLWGGCVVDMVCCLDNDNVGLVSLGVEGLDWRFVTVLLDSEWMVDFGLLRS